jgi:hypothetical protein
MFITLPIMDRLKSKTAPSGDNPSLVKEKAATWKKRMKMKKGKRSIRKTSHINGISKPPFDNKNY